MAGEVRVEYDAAAIRMVARDRAVLAAMDRLAGEAVRTMKRLCPVSPVLPVYAQPVPLGRSTGPVYGGGGARHKGVRYQAGASRSRRRLPGDLPLPASGTLRTSVHSFRQGDGSIIIGPTAPYARYVNDGTPPHEIRSTGPWPLRNRATGQVFGRVVQHPGTEAVHFVQRTADSLNGWSAHV